MKVYPFFKFGMQRAATLPFGLRSLEVEKMGEPYRCCC